MSELVDAGPSGVERAHVESRRKARPHTEGKIPLRVEGQESYTGVR
jgi:hypothetical protein